MGTLKDIVYLNPVQYEELKTQGTITVSGVTYTYEPDKNLYFVSDSVITTLPTSGRLLPDCIYDVGQITQDITIDFEPTTQGYYGMYMIRFSIGTTVPTITFGSGIQHWAYNTPITLSANTNYGIYVINGVAKFDYYV